MDIRQMIGKEVVTPAGEYVGMAESVKYIDGAGNSCQARQHGTT